MQHTQGSQHMWQLNMSTSSCKVPQQVWCELMCSSFVSSRKCCDLWRSLWVSVTHAHASHVKKTRTVFRCSQFTQQSGRGWKWLRCEAAALTGGGEEPGFVLSLTPDRDIDATRLFDQRHWRLFVRAADTVVHCLWTHSVYNGSLCCWWRREQCLRWWRSKVRYETSKMNSNPESGKHLQVCFCTVKRQSQCSHMKWWGYFLFDFISVLIKFPI